VETRKITKTYNTEARIDKAISYLDWWDKKTGTMPYLALEYDYDGEFALVNLCLTDGCLHQEDVIESVKYTTQDR